MTRFQVLVELMELLTWIKFGGAAFSYIVLVHVTAVNSTSSGHPFSNRLAREWQTVQAMIHIYCRDKHGGGLCCDCQDLTRYVSSRLAHCRFGGQKPTCARCPVHCYQRDRREQIKTVMRYAGPRMLWQHPWLSLRHWLDGWLQNQAAAAFEKVKAPRAPGCVHTALK